MRLSLKVTEFGLHKRRWGGKKGEREGDGVGSPPLSLSFFTVYQLDLILVS